MQQNQIPSSLSSLPVSGNSWYGIGHDGFPNADKFLLHLANVVKSALGQPAAARINPRVWTLGDRAICRVECPPSPEPAFVKFQGEEKFYVRSGPSTEEMGPSAMHEYVGERFGG